jgi:hypothetical protein
MWRVLQRRPSASMVVSLVALVVATSGTAVAASNLVSGDKLIRKGTLSGNRLRRHTLTRTQINLKQLGTVPSAGSAATAGYAGHAASADSATNAVNATNATNAGNAAALGGRPAASYLTTGSRVGTGGTVTMAGTPSGTTMTLFSSGPFTVTMTCRTSASGDTAISVDASTSEAGAVIDATPDIPAGSGANLGFFNLSPNAQVNGGTFTLEAPSGAGLVFAGSYGTDSAGIDSGCWANFAGIA